MADQLVQLVASFSRGPLRPGLPIALNTLSPLRTLSRLRIERPPIAAIVTQHVEEAAHLRHVRSVLVRAPHVGLLQLGRLDERIAAHLDGIAVAGGYGTRVAYQALEHSGAGEVFTATVRAIEDRDARRLDELFANSIAAAAPAIFRGLLSAFGWVSAPALQGITKALLYAAPPWRREIGLAACAMHGVNPGTALDGALGDDDASLRARALRAAAPCGRLDLADACVAALADADADCAFEAARSALLLGDRTESVAALESLAMTELAQGARGAAALRLVLKVAPTRRARSMLASLSHQGPAGVRTLLQGIAIAGDPHYAPWLIAQMEHSKLARLAGESFGYITGLDLAALGLDQSAPENVEAGPNDDPDDENVAMDEDDSLPWPDPAKVGAWWRSNGTRFVSGQRYFMGGRPQPSHCLHVLRTGSQRQRIAAAEYLSLLTPGTPLFNTAAPVWRQQRLLARMAV